MTFILIIFMFLYVSKKVLKLDVVYFTHFHSVRWIMNWSERISSFVLGHCHRMSQYIARFQYYQYTSTPDFETLQWLCPCVCCMVSFLDLHWIRLQRVRLLQAPGSDEQGFLIKELFCATSTFLRIKILVVSGTLCTIWRDGVFLY